jgi:hypothetical protein
MANIQIVRIFELNSGYPGLGVTYKVNNGPERIGRISAETITELITNIEKPKIIAVSKRKYTHILCQP